MRLDPFDAVLRLAWRDAIATPLLSLQETPHLKKPAGYVARATPSIMLRTHTPYQTVMLPLLNLFSAGYKYDGAVQTRPTPATRHDTGRTAVAKCLANQSDRMVQPALQAQPMLHRQHRAPGGHRHPSGRGGNTAVGSAPCRAREWPAAPVARQRDVAIPPDLESDAPVRYNTGRE
jgi:hypothetical protein